MKSFVMALFLFAVSLGNGFTALVNVFIQNPDGSVRLSGAAYYLFFAALMILASFGFIAFASRYREHRYVQGTDGPIPPARSDVDPKPEAVEA
jgi:POT family proton-dependent oligopeptide transporter